MHQVVELKSRSREREKKKKHTSDVNVTPKSKTNSPRKKHTEEKEKPLPKLPLYLNAIIPKPYKILDASKLAAERKKQEERDKLLPDLTPYLNVALEDLDEIVFDDDEEVSKLLQKELNLNTNDHLFDDTSLFIGNPGIDIKRMQFPKQICHSHYLFFKRIIRKIDEVNNKDLWILLNVIFKEIKEEDLSEDETIIYFILSCAVVLDVKCRAVLPDTNHFNILSDLVRKIPLSSQDLLLNTLVDTAMENFTHFHDRLSIVECLFSWKVKPSRIQTYSLNFNSILSKHILIRTLCDLIAYDTKLIDEVNSFKRLKKILLAGKNIKSLDHYSVYVLIKVLSILNTMIIYKDEAAMLHDRKARNWFLLFLTRLTGNQTRESMLLADFCAVKFLCARSTYLWKENCD